MGKGMAKLIKTLDRISWGVHLISSWGLFVLMIIGIASIILRLIGFGLQGAINLSVYILVAIVYLALAYAQSQKQHIAVEIVISRLKDRPKRVLAIAAVILAFVSTSLILWTSAKFGWASWLVREKMDGYPYYPIYPAKISLVIGVFVLWMQLIADFFRAFLKMTKDY